MSTDQRILYRRSDMRREAERCQSGAFVVYFQEKEPEEGTMEVRLQPCKSYEMEACRAAVKAAAGDLGWVKAGMRIGIKTNLLSAMAPERAGTTHPAVLAALTELLVARGAEVIIGDSPGGVYNALYLDKVYQTCGLQQAVEAGARLNGDFSTADTAFPDGAVLKSFVRTAWLDHCDAIINCCKLKTHGMMTMTCAVKNFFGTIPGTVKPAYHYRFPDAEDFASMLVDLQLYWKPRLHIVDAVEAMEGNGPSSGTPKHLGLLLGSEDPFALDQVCAQLIGLQPEQVLTQKLALQRGLVPAFTVNRPWEDFVQPFLLPPTRSTLFHKTLPGMLGDALQKKLKRATSPRPVLTGDCIGCAKCAKICPAKAITMVKNQPKFNRKTCIGCFCCQEFCPKGALESRQPPLARLLTK